MHQEITHNTFVGAVQSVIFYYSAGSFLMNEVK